jgi:hypothetical protein
MRVEVRGKVYESVPEAAKALKVSKQTIYTSMERGTLDGVGLRKYGAKNPRGGRKPIPVTVAGHTWPSIGDCARDLGLDHRYVRNVLLRDGALAKERFKQRVYRWAMERSAKEGKA